MKWSYSQYASDRLNRYWAPTKNESGSQYIQQLAMDTAHKTIQENNLPEVISVLEIAMTLYSRWGNHHAMVVTAESEHIILEAFEGYCNELVHIIKGATPTTTPEASQSHTERSQEDNDTDLEVW